ncbi:acylglycerol lipase [Malassezia brasiliensis]|uniref:Acylglycerol lipase n=1 Tax=Malassezia brasiliensis TaxID=1821822 RepID=A0AAF0INC6_9BASI|nr:acylglycerol lipase [Malassezia brasiliensis]
MVNWSTLARMNLYVLAAGGAYIALMFALGIPEFQRHYLFLHKIGYPFSPRYEEPHHHGLEPAQARNLQITTDDGIKIGVWHHLPDSLYHQMVGQVDEQNPELPEELYERALREYPTFVYLHGNALNRAAKFRVRTYQLLSKVQNANVIAIDYRGFGDSESFPTEEGVVNDAYAAVKYVREKSRNPDTGKRPALALMGQSLGTGVATQCALRMYREKIPLDALVLLAAFKAIRPMVVEFRMGGLVPLLGWLEYFPFREQIIEKLLHYSFDTQAALTEIVDGHLQPDAMVPPSIVLMHAENDEVIPVRHGDELYESVEKQFNALKRESTYHVWSSNVPDVGFVQAVMHRSAPLPEKKGLLPGARAVLPRNAVMTYIRLEDGGHNHLFDRNADLLPLILPIGLTGLGHAPAVHGPARPDPAKAA